MLFCETHDLVWEMISVSEKRVKNCIVKILRRWVISFNFTFPNVKKLKSVLQENLSVICHHKNVWVKSIRFLLCVKIIIYLYPNAPYVKTMDELGMSRS